MGRTPADRHAFRILAGLLLAALPVAADDLPALKPSGAKPAYDSTSAVLGSATFKTYCASCHGTTAQGDGPVAEQLRFAPPDLTRMAGRNGGRFPSDKVTKIIDGRNGLRGHGGTDMPVWGDVFLESRDGYSPAKVREKIEELVQYLASLQESRP
jgi:mono/diheme cytochrome c family protein